MNDLTVAKFCKQFGACPEGKKWAYNLTEKRSKAMMSELWEEYRKNPTIKHFEFFLWAINRGGVFSDSILRKMACRFVRETPLADGRKVWDLLAYERSKNAVIISEKFANGEANQNDLAAARGAAWDAARGAARGDASAAARGAAWDAARGDASAAARVAARSAARSAAWDAAWDAAWGAAWDAAWDAARDAQLSIIFEYGNPWVNK